MNSINNMYKRKDNIVQLENNVIGYGICGLKSHFSREEYRLLGEKQKTLCERMI